MPKRTKRLRCATVLVAVTLMVSCKRDSAETQATTPQAHEETPEFRPYPMEVHVVNMLEPVAPQDPPRYLVLSFLFRMGKEDLFIQSFLDQVSDEAGGKALEAGEVYIAQRDRDLRYQYYHSRGSLTTPPYTETVEWLIVKDIQEASPEQVRRVNLIEGDNARRVQALFGLKFSF